MACEWPEGWACDLVPKPLIVARFFAKEQDATTKLEAEVESVTALIAELVEEHGGDEGAFSEFDKVNKASVTARLRELEGLFASDQEAKDEAALLNRWRKLSNEEATLKTKLKDAEADLDARAYAKYPTLTEAEVQALAVDDKWLAALDAMIHGEMDRISQALTQRVKELADAVRIPIADADRPRRRAGEPGERAPGKDGFRMELTPANTYDELLQRIATTLETGRAQAVRAVSAYNLETYWRVGRDRRV